MSRENEMKKRKYWYLFWEVYCPACDYVMDKGKERRYTRKPKSWSKRHEIMEQACYSCMMGAF